MIKHILHRHTNSNPNPIKTNFEFSRFSLFCFEMRIVAALCLVFVCVFVPASEASKFVISVGVQKINDQS